MSILKPALANHKDLGHWQSNDPIKTLRVRHVASAKRGKTRASESRVVLNKTSDWMKKWRELVSSSELKMEVIFLKKKIMQKNLASDQFLVRTLPFTRSICKDVEHSEGYSPLS